MPISAVDGDYGLDVYMSANDHEPAIKGDYCNNLMELRARAITILKAGRYPVVVITRWNAQDDEWEEVEELTIDDLE